MHIYHTMYITTHSSNLDNETNDVYKLMTLHVCLYL